MVLWGIIWGIVEPILMGVQIVFRIRSKHHSKLEEDQFDRLFKDSFKSIISYLEQFGMRSNVVAPSPVNTYLSDIKNEMNSKNNFYIFQKGEIESRIFRKLNLSTENRFNIFICYSYLYVQGYDRYFKYSLFKEKIRRFFRRGRTIHHYLSIPGWRTLNYLDLIKKVADVKKVDPLWNEKYKYNEQNIQDFEKNNPTIAKTIEMALRRGKISNQTILNLASTDKLILIHKYAEGFGDVYTDQRNLQNKINDEITKWKKSKAKDAGGKLLKAKTNLKKLQSEWIRVPLSTTIESQGFQKLFNKMDGVYVLPLSMIPEKYHGDINLYISDVLISNALSRLNEIKELYGQVFEIPDDLKFIMVAHVVRLDELFIRSRGRDINISSPALSRMLFTSYIARENSQMSNLYVNDIIKNVDFLSGFRSSTKTYDYFKRNHELLKSILWSEYDIDLYKPIQLTILHDDQIRSVSDKLFNQDGSIGKGFITNGLKKSRDFYVNLNDELEKFRE